MDAEDTFSLTVYVQDTSCKQQLYPSEHAHSVLQYPRLEEHQWTVQMTMMKMMVLPVFLLLAVLGLGSGEEGARLLASKSLLNRYAVEGRDLTLQYNLYNVGSSAALEVELSDDSFPPEDFGIVSGMLNVKWDRIAPASNVSHTVVLRPLKAGYFNFTSASVSYLAQEGGQVVVGYTSAPGQGGILAQREFDRRFSPHYLDWAAFGVMTLPSIGIPLLLWYSSKRKYDSPKAKKN
ncbi:translocon-associated protein subunit beta isoform X1 [Etheostoma cragini]|uniref:translocon-associated protein subunit beta isoform X1 n=2 Tax=Etheostoma cragini TaxID=417921 RepID=UPI00155F224B|nr:translocon-associated protein subunit beta isoform X1 [Etheostoma cragini]